MDESHERVIIDDDGDIDLLVGDEKKRLRVSSKVLMLASKVFRVMFSKKFKEGTDLRTNTTAIPIEVSLPEDDVDSMTLLSWVLHFKNYRLPTSILADDLNKLAILIDKYDCVEAVKFVTRSWFEAFEGKESAEITQLVVLAEAAWILDDTIAFRHSTRALVFSSKWEDLMTLKDKDLVLSSFTISEIAAQTQDCTDKLMADIVRPSKNMMEHATAYHFPNNEHGTILSGDPSYAPGRHDWVRSCSLNLLQEPLRYAGTSKSEHSIMDVIHHLEGLASAEEPIYQMIVSSRNGRGGLGGSLPGRTVKETKFTSQNAGCRACQFDLKSYFAETIDKAKKSVNGLCLVCMKLGVCCFGEKACVSCRYCE